MNRLAHIQFMVSVAATVFISCGFSHQPKSFKTYKTVKIGNQVWMAENLTVDTFRNGDRIPEAKDPQDWVTACQKKQPAWCHYKNLKKYGTRYGKLYNWYAVNDPRGLAPVGWHIPSDEEWEQLSNYLGGDEVAGLKLKSTKGWKQDGKGTNESGFNGLPAGCRSYRLTNADGVFWQKGEYGYWWSATRRDSKILELAGYCAVGYDGIYFDRSATSPDHGNYVRCLKD